MKAFYLFFVMSFYFVLNAVGQDFQIHKVKQGETLYGLSKKYDVPINVIYKNNPALTSDNLKLGTEIRIPKKKNTTKSTFVTKTSTVPKIDNSNKYDTILHQVKSKETMYAISKLYNVSIEEIKKWNNLSSTDLNLDEVIKILKPKTVETKNVLPKQSNTSNLNKEETKKIEETIVKSTAKTTIPIAEVKEQKLNIDTPKNENVVTEIKTLTLSEQFSIQKKENSIINKKATGAPMNTSDLSINNTFFALHKTAKIGSIIKIKNLENNKISYAKIIGTLPEIDENKNVMIRLSLGVRNAINMGKGKAYLEMEYVE
jgi:LysM repeat protein